MSCDNKCLCELCPPGPRGAQGLQGPAGPSGLQGSEGAQGQNGSQGLPGSAGVSGPAGPNGPAGIKGDKGDLGETGAQGLQGAKGDQGSQGAKGDIGVTGATGSQGVTGATGATGPQGLPGDKLGVYLNAYSTKPQTAGAYGSATDGVLFDKVSTISDPSDFDVSSLAVDGKIKVLKHGVYLLRWIAQAKIHAPVPSPVPSWSFAFFLDSVMVPGSIYSGFTDSPDNDAAHSTSESQVEIMAGQILQMRSTSLNSIDLDPSTLGNAFPITRGSVNIIKLKSLA